MRTTLYYFLLAFAGNTCHIVSIIVTPTTHEMTDPLFRKAREATGLSESAALLSVSSLGKMNQEMYETSYKKQFPWLMTIVIVLIWVIGGLLCFLLNKA